MNQALNTRCLFAEYGISMGTRFFEHLHAIRVDFFFFNIHFSYSISCDKGNG